MVVHKALLLYIVFSFCYLAQLGLHEIRRELGLLSKTQRGIKTDGVATPPTLYRAPKREIRKMPLLRPRNRLLGQPNEETPFGKQFPTPFLLASPLEIPRIPQLTASETAFWQLCRILRYWSFIIRSLACWRSETALVGLCLWESDFDPQRQISS